MANLDMAASAVGAEMDMGKLGFPRGQIENWGDSGVVVTSPRTDASTDADTDDRNQAVSFLCSCLDFGFLRPLHWSLGLLISSFWIVWWCHLRLEPISKGLSCLWIHLLHPRENQGTRRCCLFSSN